MQAIHRAECYPKRKCGPSGGARGHLASSIGEIWRLSVIPTVQDCQREGSTKGQDPERFQIRTMQSLATPIVGFLPKPAAIDPKLSLRWGAATFSTPLPRLLNRRTWHVAEGAEHAAIASKRPQYVATIFAVIEELTGVCRHGFRGNAAALGTG